jgi:hypothetical protein
MGEKTNTVRLLVENPEGKTLLATPESRQKNDTEILDEKEGAVLVGFILLCIETSGQLL